MGDKKTAYREAIDYLFGLQKYGIKFGLSKTSNLLHSFGNPHNGRKYVHIAGTNGKGSVAAFIASILKEAGFKVGFYSSPHLVRFTERFRINDEEISRKKATDLIWELKDAFDLSEPPTFFEGVTAMALVYFAREGTDIDIMEVGMGGRLDATNVITPLVSVITNIALEHQFFLGNRLLDIAGEKAGIIKEGVDVVTGATQTKVIRLIESIAKEKGAPLWRVDKDIKYRQTASGLHYKGLKRRFKEFQLGLTGGFQARNAALALGVVERLEDKGFQVSSENIKEGLKKAKWPGRMHVVSQRPMILLDGAHNPRAVRELARAVKSTFTYRRLILVIGVMEDKDIRTLLQGIVPIADYVIYTRPVYYRAASPEILMQKAGSPERPGEMLPLLTESIDRARNMADPNDMILITGSLFTVGEAMSHLDPIANRPDGF
jgi:dihydrofolate synthase/folylpolyglutamate synthase